MHTSSRLHPPIRSGACMAAGVVLLALGTTGGPVLLALGALLLAIGAGSVARNHRAQRP